MFRQINKLWLISIYDWVLCLPRRGCKWRNTWTWATWCDQLMFGLIRLVWKRAFIALGKFWFKPMYLFWEIFDFSIRAYDVSCIAKGPVFQVPVTVVKPTVPNDEEPDITERKVLFQTGMIRRHFILVPEQATWIGMFILSKKRRINLLRLKWFD